MNRLTRDPLPHSSAEMSLLSRVCNVFVRVNCLSCQQPGSHQGGFSGWQVRVPEAGASCPPPASGSGPLTHPVWVCEWRRVSQMGDWVSSRELPGPRACSTGMGPWFPSSSGGGAGAAKLCADQAIGSSPRTSFPPTPRALCPRPGGRCLQGAGTPG